MRPQVTASKRPSCCSSQAPEKASPCAKRINLSETDLPPALWVDDIDGDETFAELAEAGGLFGRAASRLHTAHLHASPHLHGEGGGRWHIDIAEALR